MTLRTDKPEAELGVYEDEEKLAYEIWEAHRKLSETIHIKIDEILNKSSKTREDLGGIVIYKGPGSFTGLRIGFTVANTMAYARQIPIVTSESDEWIERGISKLKAGADEKIALPDYGAPPHITEQKK